MSEAFKEIIKFMKYACLKIRFCFHISFFLKNIEKKFVSCTKKKKFAVKDFFSKCEQIRRKLRICSHLEKKFRMENIIFVQWSL